MKIGIIGGGITGLSAAWTLAKKGHEVVVFEKSKTAGGLGTYIPVNKNYIESFYHHFFSSDKEIINMSKELGIGKKLKFYPAKTGIFIKNTVYPFNSAMDLLRFSPLSFFDRIRCGIMLGLFKVLVIPPYILDKISAEKFIKKIAGENVYKVIWGPLLEGKFSKFAKKIPALWLWGRVKDRSLKLGYFDGSVRILFEKLITAIKKKKGTVRLGAEITGVESKNGTVTIMEKDKNYVFDKVIITTVSPITKFIVKNRLSSKEEKLFSSIDHLGAVCVVLELDKPLQNRYWLNICEKNAPVLVIVEHTNMVGTKQYGGRSLLYLANYIHRSEKRFQKTDKEILDDYISYLPVINKKFKRSWIKKAYVNRVPRAQTIFSLHANSKKPPVKLSVPNIFMVNIDQMYPHDRNLNQGIQLGKKAARMALE
ncbi:MAG TPA: FAD-dependent oxidoreductase [Patescibacteria group bacterium]|nr:FAD-dependent oxidoreductase [Patescibacteria group bacterium]